MGERQVQQQREGEAGGEHAEAPDQRGSLVPADPDGCEPDQTGEEGQVDYGDGPMVRDPASGKYKRTRLFVLTLGYSRKAVGLLV